MAEFRVLFHAADYVATVGWFTDVLGLEVHESWAEPAPGTVLAAGDGRIEVLAPGATPPPAVAGVQLAWEVADVHAEHDRLLAAGASVVEGPTRRPWGHESLVVEGPDGWAITLFEVMGPD